jgi:hypothetical protein
VQALCIVRHRTPNHLRLTHPLGNSPASLMQIWLAMIAVGDVREVMDRVFFNTLLIMKGIVLAYGATTLVALVRRDVPWSSTEELAVYIAWATTILLVALTLVSQAFGSDQTPLHPTTAVILLTLVLAIEEFVAFGLLEPQQDEVITIRPWFLAVAVQAGTAFLFVTVVLYHSKSGRHPHTTLTRENERLVRADQFGAGVLTAIAILTWGLLTSSVISDASSWLPALIVGVIVFCALVQQQRKVDVYRLPDSGAERYDDGNDARGDAEQ